MPNALKRAILALRKAHNFTVNSVFMDWRIRILESDAQHAAVNEGLSALGVVVKRRYRLAFWTMRAKTSTKEQQREAVKRLRMAMQRKTQGPFNAWKSKVV